MTYRRSDLPKLLAFIRVHSWFRLVACRTDGSTSRKNIGSCRARACFRRQGAASRETESVQEVPQAGGTPAATETLFGRRRFGSRSGPSHSTGRGPSALVRRSHRVFTQWRRSSASRAISDRRLRSWRIESVQRRRYSVL